MAQLNKTIRIGRTSDGDVFCKIKFTENRLSITGVVGPKHNGDCRGSCGQINPLEYAYEFAEGWDKETLEGFAAIWREWHLNDMKAGSPAQSAFIKANPSLCGEYRQTKAALEVAGLEPDASHMYHGTPYNYGSAWLFVAVPESVLVWLQALPTTDKRPAWV